MGRKRRRKTTNVLECKQQAQREEIDCMTDRKEEKAVQLSREGRYAILPPFLGQEKGQLLVHMKREAISTHEILTLRTLLRVQTFVRGDRAHQSNTPEQALVCKANQCALYKPIRTQKACHCGGFAHWHACM